MPKSLSAAMSNEEENKLTFTTQYQGSSFLELLQTDFQHILPDVTRSDARDAAAPLPTATTILALRYQDGVLIAGDRRAVEGHRIASRHIEKIFKTDSHSALGVAGVAALCLDLAKLFRTELEHYEKIEGEQLMLDGKANKLAHMLRQNLPMALQGLAVVPIFVGYDPQRQTGRIFKYDVIGGMYEEEQFYATGSGGKDARNTIKKLYQPDLDEEQAVKLAIEALFDASEEDAATGGPDALRRIYPNLMSVTAQGVQTIPDDQIAARYADLLTDQFGDAAART